MSILLGCSPTSRIQDGSNFSFSSNNTQNHSRGTDEYTYYPQEPPSSAAVTETKISPSNGVNDVAKSAPSESKPGSGTRKKDLPADSLFILFGSAFGLLASAGFVRNRRKARKISEWARAHKRTTWGIFAIGHVGIGTLAYFAGKNMGDMGLIIGDHSMWILGSIALVAALFYPMRGSRIALWKHTYLRHKLHDLTILTAGTLLLMGIVCQGGANPLLTRIGIPEVQVSGLAGQVLDSEPASESTTLASAIEKPILNASRLSSVVKVLLTILAVIIALVVAYLLALLSCSLACSGAEALAWVVLLLGGGALIFGFVRVMISIWQNKKPEPNPTTP